MRAIFSGGGTGGHIYPAISIAKELQRRHNDAEIVFIGTDKGMEKEIVPNEGYSLEKIKVRGFARKVSLENVKTLYEAFISLFSAAKIIKKFKPDIVIGTGGYVCGPVVLIASMMNIPTLIHEQNAFPGITNKLLSKKVDKIAVTFEESKKFFKDNTKISFTGNPLRHGFLAVLKEDGLKTFGFSKDIPLVLIVGGSRGAKRINESAMKLIRESNKKGNMQILHITGQTQYESCLELYRKNEINLNLNNIKVVPYIHNMPEALAACDLVVGRCGAGVLSEITVMGKPSILIPYPYATDNHQEYNARALEKGRASIVITENELNEDILFEQINDIINNKEKLREMSKNSKDLSKPKAAEDIVDIIESLVRK